jgi:glycosyltransferase involved in cell wall biosynthesis
MRNNSKVSLVKGDNRKENIRKCLKLIKDDLGPIRDAKNILIKPNLVALKPAFANTHVEAIEATIDYIREIAPDTPITVGESSASAFYNGLPTSKVFEDYDYYRLVKKYNDCVLVLAGSPATDDPEGATVLKEVKEFAANDKDIRILLLPPFSDKDINALQRMAAVVLQKSLKEGFGLTVSEAMWKGKPVLGGASGGIPLQIAHGVTGFLVHSVEGAAFRIRQLLNNPEMSKRMGEQAKEYVRHNFLITRQVRDYLAAWYSLENKGKSILEL